jgi:pimeloyl-ACP methyl ester carboxylesterase
MELPLGAVPRPDPGAEPEGFVVLADSGDRIHFLDWGGTVDASADRPGALLIHGLSQSAWLWSPVARRLRGAAPTVALDLRGHGLSDAPTEDPDVAYALPTLAGDAVAVAEGSGLLAGSADRVILAGHGFGGIVAAEAASALGARCAGLVLVDGGWEDLERASGVDVEEFLRALDEPPEVLASMTAFLADRAGFDPGTWDDDQERAARATVVETHAGRVVPATRPHALEACVRAMFGYDPADVLARVDAPVIALAAADDEEASRAAALATASAARERAGRGRIDVVSFPHDGHNLMRYRPAEVTAAILAFGPGRPD